MNLSNVKLIVATPCYGGNCDTVYVKSLLSLQQICFHNNINVEFFIPDGNLDIAHARNKIVYEILNKAFFTHLLFIDSDIGFNALDVLKMIESDVDVICGTYAKKYINWDFIVKEINRGTPVNELHYYTSPYIIKLLDDKDYSKVNLNEPIEIEYCGAGMMMIKRKVFEQLQPHTETYISLDDEVPANKNLIYNFFKFHINETGERMSEDVYFCRKWIKFGGKIHVAPWVNLKHVGKYNFGSKLWRE